MQAYDPLRCTLCVREHCRFLARGITGASSQKQLKLWLVRGGVRRIERRAGPGVIRLTAFLPTRYVAARDRLLNRPLYVLPVRQISAALLAVLR